MEKFYIEITDERIELDPPYVYQSCTFNKKEEAIKFGKKLAKKLNQNNISFFKNKKTCDYLNPGWPFSKIGVEQYLHIDVMVMIFEKDKDYYSDIGIEENIK